MFSYPELSSNPPIGSDRESGCDKQASSEIGAHRTASVISVFLE